MEVNLNLCRVNRRYLVGFKSIPPEHKIIGGEVYEHDTRGGSYTVLNPCVENCTNGPDDGKIFIYYNTSDDGPVKHFVKSEEEFRKKFSLKKSQ